MTDDEEDGSLTSFPARPSSPLPISTGPDNEKYIFSPSPSPSPCASPLASTERLPLLNGSKLCNGKKASARSSFSVDRSLPPYEPSSEKSSCLLELLEWIIHRCCSLCSSNINSHLKLHHQNSRIRLMPNPIDLHSHKNGATQMFM